MSDTATPTPRLVTVDADALDALLCYVEDMRDVHAGLLPADLLDAYRILDAQATPPEEDALD